MVLDEILIIHGHIDGDGPEIARIFREAGMPVRITTTSVMEEHVSLKGRISNIKALLKEEISRIEEFNREFVIDEDDEEFGTDEDDGEFGTDEDDEEFGTDEDDEEFEDDEDAEPEQVYKLFLGMVERIEADIAEFMEKYQPGDVVLIDDLKGWMAPDAEREGKQKILESALHKIMALTMLNENGLIETDGERVTVKGHMDLADMIIALPGAFADDIDPEDLKEHSVLMEMTIIPVPEYLLEFGPEAIIEGDLDAVEEIAEDLEIDEEAYMSFRSGVSLKKVVIGRTLEIIEEHGPLAPAEVTKILRGSAIEDTTDGYKIMLDLAPEFVRALLNDLKKVGLVRKKGEKFRSI